MQPSAVAAMALAARANCPDCWPEGCRPEARRRRITTAPQLRLMSMTATVGEVVEVNGECNGNGNSNGPVDDNNNNNYDVGNDDDNDNNGGGQDRSANVGRLWKSGRRWR
jgi:hypothetical protein